MARETREQGVVVSLGQCSRQCLRQATYEWIAESTYIFFLPPLRPFDTFFWFLPKKRGGGESDRPAISVGQKCRDEHTRKSSHAIRVSHGSLHRGRPKTVRLVPVLFPPLRPLA
jgi:hypothetical protein